MKHKYVERSDDIKLTINELTIDMVCQVCQVTPVY